MRFKDSTGVHGYFWTVGKYRTEKIMIISGSEISRLSGSRDGEVRVKSPWRSDCTTPS